MSVTASAVAVKNSRGETAADETKQRNTGNRIDGQVAEGQHHREQWRPDHEGAPTPTIDRRTDERSHEQRRHEVDRRCEARHEPRRPQLAVEVTRNR